MKVEIMDFSHLIFGPQEMIVCPEQSRQVQKTKSLKKLGEKMKKVYRSMTELEQRE